jgi:hypothetical protein
MPVWLGFVLFIAAWAHPFGIVAIRRTVFGFGGRGHLSIGPLCGHLVAQSASAQKAFYPPIVGMVGNSYLGISSGLPVARPQISGREPLANQLSRPGL